MSGFQGFAAALALLLVPPGAAAPSDPSAEIEAIKAQSERFSKAYVEEDIDTLVFIYAEDGVAGPGGRNFIRGRDALRRYWQVAEGVDVIRHRAVPEEILVEGRFAYDWGHYSGATVSGGKTNEFRGKYLIVWRKDEDGVWRMAQDMWSGVPAE